MVGAQVTMREAIVEMTAKGLGILAVLDDAQNLVGALTDGDLRRHIADANLLDLKVETIMTRNPRVIAEDELISAATREMETAHITALFVLNKHNRLAGLIRLSDLARIGVI